MGMRFFTERKPRALRFTAENRCSPPSPLQKGIGGAGMPSRWFSIIAAALTIFPQIRVGYFRPPHLHPPAPLAHLLTGAGFVRQPGDILKDQPHLIGPRRRKGFALEFFDLGGLLPGEVLRIFPPQPWRAFEHGPRAAFLPAFLTSRVVHRFTHRRDDMEFVAPPRLRADVLIRSRDIYPGLMSMEIPVIAR